MVSLPSSSDRPTLAADAPPRRMAGHYRLFGFAGPADLPASRGADRPPVAPVDPRAWYRSGCGARPKLLGAAA